MLNPSPSLSTNDSVSLVSHFAGHHAESSRQPSNTTPEIAAQTTPAVPDNTNDIVPYHTLPSQPSPLHDHQPPSSPFIPSTEPMGTMRSHAMTTKSQNNIFKPKPPSDNFIRYPLPKALLTSLTSSDIEPTCYSEAIKSSQWRTAMNAEFDALLQNKTWSLVSPPPAVNVVGCRWIYKLKKKADGSIDRYKARLVSKGFHQQEGVDFTEIFSPVVKHATIRTVLSLAVSNQWHIQQIDIQNAFLHGALEEEVFMAQPPGYIHPQYPHHLCKLHKSI